MIRCQPIKYGSGFNQIFGSRIVGVGGSGLVRYKDRPFITGNWSNPGQIAGGTYLYDVVYANGMYVAGGYQGVYTSQDAITWTQRLIPGFSSSDVQNLAYGNGVFVAISGLTSVLAYSTDAINWTLATSSMGQENTGTLAFGGNCFLATGRYGKVMRSTNGIDWSNVTTGLPTTVSSIPYVIVWTGSEFVITTDNSNQAVRSSDGITWSPLTIGTRGTGTYYFGGVYAPGKGMLLIEGGYYRKSDSNLSNWTQYPLTGFGSVSAVIYDGTNFIAAAMSQSICKYSSDGITWIDISSNLSLAGGGISKFVINRPE